VTTGLKTTTTKMKVVKICSLVERNRTFLFRFSHNRGISIQNPGQKAQDEVRSILGRAVQAPMPVGPDPRPQHFGGTGYTLGSEATPSQPIGQPQSQQQRQGPTRRQLTLWRNGFTVDDGPLYAYSDPESLEILREIRMGRLPRNIAGVQLGEDVEMQVHKRENEDWTPGITDQGRGRGSAASGAFVGRGNRLGRYPHPTNINLMVVQFQENLLLPLHHHHNPLQPNQRNPNQPNQSPASIPPSPKPQSNSVSLTEPDSSLSSISLLLWKPCTPSSPEPVQLKTANSSYRPFSRLEFSKEVQKQSNRRDCKVEL
jgi:SEP domain